MRTSIDVFAKAREHERLEQLRAARELDLVPWPFIVVPPVFILWRPHEKTAWGNPSHPLLNCTDAKRHPRARYRWHAASGYRP